MVVVVVEAVVDRLRQGRVVLVGLRAKPLKRVVKLLVRVKRRLGLLRRRQRKRQKRGLERGEAREQRRKQRRRQRGR